METALPLLVRDDSEREMLYMNLSTPLAANIINLCVAVATFAAVLVAFFAIRENRKQSDIAWQRTQKGAEEDRQENSRQAQEAWERTQQLAKEERQHAQQLAIDDRQHQSRPILAPVGELAHASDGKVYWHPFVPPKEVQGIHIPVRYMEQPMNIQNMGNGPAFNVHVVLYGPSLSSFTSWNNGPIAGDGSLKIIAAHGGINLGEEVTVDGVHQLYASDDLNYRIARLTMTYSDLFDRYHVSVFDYMLISPGEYRWMHLATKSGIEKDLEDLEFEKVHNSRRQKPTK